MDLDQFFSGVGLGPRMSWLDFEADPEPYADPGIFYGSINIVRSGIFWNFKKFLKKLIDLDFFFLVG